ncbi:hypothetical protein OHA21_43825 [Actinoplanes sp. NBC_00393]|uniref:hypothetical protein n=1 Tax=Actinoplanes sp. NBC_00393 TaxID=2975953 RepID=UPI002E1B018F
MAKFTVNHAYKASRDGQQLGPWKPGDVVDLEQADADWVNRDSPGCMSPTSAAPAEGAARQRSASKDRQHRGGANRSN